MEMQLFLIRSQSQPPTINLSPTQVLFILFKVQTYI